MRWQIGMVSGRRRRARIGAAVASTALLACPVAAQTDPQVPVSGDTVVVVGQKAREREKQIADYVRGLTPAPGRDPLARFAVEKLCPGAIGLGDVDKAIVARMRRVATAAKIDLGNADCHVNALVIFADSKAATVDLLHKKYPDLFRNRMDDPIRVPIDARPDVAWHIDAMMTRDGIRTMPGQQNGTTTPPSRIQASLRPFFQAGIVIIEFRGLVGLTTTQIADYAAMRVFTDADPAKVTASGAPTILTVLDAPMDSETPASLTNWDLGFLRGLYAATPNSFANSQRGEIRESIKRQLKDATGNGD